MMQDHPVAARYLSRLNTSLSDIDVSERAGILEEMRNHIAEAHASGKSIEDVIESLGPADLLARAYAVELLMNPRDKRGRNLKKWIKAAAIVAASSVATFLVFVALGSIGIALTASGAGIFVIGALEASGIHLPGVQLNGLPPVAVMLIAPLLLVAGAAALFALRGYVRFLARTLRKFLPREGHASSIA